MAHQRVPREPPYAHELTFDNAHEDHRASGLHYRQNLQQPQYMSNLTYGDSSAFLNLETSNDSSTYMNAQALPNSPPHAHGPPSQYQMGNTDFQKRSGQISQQRFQGAFDNNQRSTVQAQDNYSRKPTQKPRTQHFIPNQDLPVEYADPLQHTFNDSFSNLTTSSNAFMVSPGIIAPAGQSALPNESRQPRVEVGGQHQAQNQIHQPSNPSNAFAEYNRLIKQTNTHSINSRLMEARSSLSRLSRWLMQNLEPLGKLKRNFDIEKSCLNFEGLIHDVEAEGDDWRKAYEQRLQFWRDIHHSWLVLLQRQWDEMRQLREPRTTNANILSKSSLQGLGDEVVQVGDALEKFGLVDYEMGFQEGELIMRTLILHSLTYTNPC